MNNNTGSQPRKDGDGDIEVIEEDIYEITGGEELPTVQPPALTPEMRGDQRGKIPRFEGRLVLRPPTPPASPRVVPPTLPPSFELRATVPPATTPSAAPMDERPSQAPTINLDAVLISEDELAARDAAMRTQIREEFAGEIRGLEATIRTQRELVDGEHARAEKCMQLVNVYLKFYHFLLEKWNEAHPNDPARARAVAAFREHIQTAQREAADADLLMDLRIALMQLAPNERARINDGAIPRCLDEVLVQIIRQLMPSLDE